MATLEQHIHARGFLKKAEEYLASAEANLSAQRHTVAAGDAIHSGICAKDAIVTELTDKTTKGKDHALAAKELRQALGQRPDAAGAEKGFANLSQARPTSSTASRSSLLRRPEHSSVEPGPSSNWLSASSVLTGSPGEG
jgi:hypothetical protein